MNFTTRPLTAFGAALLTVSFVGCGGKAETPSDAPPISIDEAEGLQGEHSHADNYPEAVAELDEMREQIEQAFAEGDIDAADGPIHEVGHVLEELVSLAKQQGVDDEALAAIGSAVQQLFDAFGRVDDKIHGGEGADYADVKAEIDAAFAELKSHLPTSE